MTSKTTTITKLHLQDSTAEAVALLPAVTHLSKITEEVAQTEAQVLIVDLVLPEEEVITSHQANLIIKTSMEEITVFRRVQSQ